MVISLGLARILETHAQLMKHGKRVRWSPTYLAWLTVLLFSHMEPVVRGVSKVLQEKGVAYNLNRVDPSAISGMLSPWLTRSARQIVETPVVGDGRVSRVLSVVRQRLHALTPAGYTGAAAALQTLLGEFGDTAAYQQAQIHAQWQAPDKAFAALSLALSLRDSGLVSLLVDPFVDPIRQDPRFLEVTRRMGLT